MSVIIQYSSIESSREAKESLHGQLYGSFRIETRYVKLSSWVLSNTSRAGTSGLLPLERGVPDSHLCSSVNAQDYLSINRSTLPVSRGAFSLSDSAAINSSLATLPRYADQEQKLLGSAATTPTTHYGNHDFNDFKSIINYRLQHFLPCK